MNPTGPCNATTNALKEQIKLRESSIASSAVEQMLHTANAALLTFSTELQSRSDTALTGFESDLNKKIAKAVEVSNKLSEKQATLQEKTQALLEQSQTLQDQSRTTIKELQVVLTKAATEISVCDQKVASTIKAVHIIMDRWAKTANQFQLAVAAIQSAPNRRLNLAFKLLVILWLVVISYQIHRSHGNRETSNDLPMIGMTNNFQTGGNSNPASSSPVTQPERN